MPAPRKYPNELRERSVRLVAEAREQDRSLSINAAVKRVGPRVGVNPDTLRGWCKQAMVDAGQAPGTSTSDNRRIKELEHEVKELKRANEILLAASSFRPGARPATAVVAAFVDEHRDQFGVEAICRVLTAHGVKTAASTYYAQHSRPPSARSLRDEQLGEQVERIFHDRRRGRGLAGVRKMWRLLRREHEVTQQFGPIARCTVERLMRARGLQGVRRHRGFSTTRAGKNVAERAPDLVKRAFHADAPNRLWVVDLTYVACWEHMGFTALVTDVYSRRIVGWRTAARMPVDLPLDALEMALWIRARTGHADPDGRLTGLIHHSDAGSVYTALRYVDRLDDAGALASIGTVGDSYDNALAESTNGLYKTECVWHDGPFATVGQLELATADWVEWFNTNRLHSSLGYLTPVEFETAYDAQSGPQEAA